MNFSESLVVLRPLHTTHDTLYGPRVGFFMSDATGALGGLVQASNALLVLVSEGLVECEFVFVGDDEDARTLYRVAELAPPTVH